MEPSNLRVRFSIDEARYMSAEMRFRTRESFVSHGLAGCETRPSENSSEWCGD